MLTFWSEQVYRVNKRDRGVCAICGWDMRQLQHIVEKRWAVRTRKKSAWGGTIVERVVPREAAAWLRGIIGNWNWEIDHIVPVCEGGGVRADMTVEQVLGNLRTLCHDCHAKETAALAARRAMARKAQKASGAE